MQKKTGMNSQTLKSRNRRLLFKLICTERAPSRIRLAQMTGLTKMTVTNIIAELMEQGFVTESIPTRSTGAGRNPITLTIASTAPKILGISLARNSCSAMLFDLKLRVLDQATESFGMETPKSVVEKLFRAVDSVYAKAPCLLGCGVSVVGPLDVESGTVLNPPDFFGIENLPLAQLLTERYHCNVQVNNDMNSAALAEKFYGAGKEYHDFIYVGISDGIGSGIIVDDRLYQNSSGFVGELGHIGINCHGGQCSCGRKGCLEYYIRKPVILGKLCKSTGWKLTFREFCEKADDPRVDEILTDMVYKLSYALISQVNLLNPQAIFIGYEGGFLPNRLIDLIRSEVNSKKFVQNHLQIHIEKSDLGLYAPLYGSACIVLDSVFEGDKLGRMDESFVTG